MKEHELNKKPCFIRLLSSLKATLKKYQGERRSKSESIERCQSQLKKLRRKSQGSRHPNKYGDREMQVGQEKFIKFNIHRMQWLLSPGNKKNL